MLGFDRFEDYPAYSPYFGAMVGLSSDQVYQRRRVWETFGDVSESYPSLKWSHFSSVVLPVVTFESGYMMKSWSKSALS